MSWLTVELYGRFRIGKTPDDLAAEFGLTAEQVRTWLRAAGSYVATHRFIPESHPCFPKRSVAPLMPFPIWLYGRYRAGKTAEDLASELGIPLERIQRRLDAAAVYVRSHRRMPDWGR